MLKAFAKVYTQVNLADDLDKFSLGGVIMFFSPVEKYDPVEMIQLMLEDSGNESFHIGFHLLSREVV